MNSLLTNLHCIHQYPSIDSFPGAIAWKTKTPVTYINGELVQRWGFFEIAFNLPLFVYLNMEMPRGNNFQTHGNLRRYHAFN